MASRVLRGGSRVGWVGGAVLLFTGALTACEDDGASTVGDGGADASTGNVSGESRDLIDAGPNGGTQDLGVTLEATSEHADTLTVGLGELSDEVDASAPSSSSEGATTSAPVTTSEVVVTSGVPTEAPTSETPDETSATPTDSTTAPATSSEPVQTSAEVPTTSDVPTTSAEVPTTSDAPTSAEVPTSETPTTSAELPTTSADVPTSETPTTSAELPTSDVPTTSAEVPTTSDVPTTSADESSSGEIIIVTSETPDAGSSSSDTSSSSEPPIEIGGEVVGSADWVDLPAAFQIVGLAEANYEYLWSIVQVPDGSAVTNDALNGRTEPQLTFVPDVAGQYTVQVSVLVGETQVVRYGSINVAKVDVGYLEMRAGSDGAYIYTPTMVPSDQSKEPHEVGCSYDSSDFGDFTWWIDALWGETNTIGFSYPEVPSDETLFAYENRGANGTFTQVATVDSDCESNRPTNLSWGRYPNFSASASSLARLDDGDGTYLMTSPPTVNEILQVSNAGARSFDWRDESSLVWTGYNCGESCASLVGLSKPGERGYVPVIDCSNASEAVWGSFDRVVSLEDALLIEADTRLWYVPLHFGGNGLPYASCEYNESDAYVIANSPSDFALAPDGKTLAVIGTFNSDYPYPYLAIGPVDVPLDFEAPWQYMQLSPGAYYTGLHWIADSKQVVWSEIELQYHPGDGNSWYELDGSRVYKINSDFSYPRILASNDVPDGYSANRVLTTGHIDINFYYQGGVDNF